MLFIGCVSKMPQATDANLNAHAHTAISLYVVIKKVYEILIAR